MTQQAVIFDVDGVLVDSYLPHFQSWQRLFGELGVEFTEETFRSTFGRANADIFAQLFGEKYTADEVKTHADRKEALYREIIKQDFPAVDGAVELIDSLAEAGFALAVGSSGPPENVAQTLESLGRAHVLTTRITGADVTRGKPDSQVFQLVAERLGIAPQRCVVVEDATAGVAAAKNADMACIALTGTATRDELGQADLVVESLLDLDAAAVAQLLP